MLRSTFTEAQIAEILQAVAGGLPIPEVLRKHGISRATFFTWRKKYGGATVAELKHLRELEAENAELKRMYADLDLEDTAFKDVLSRKL